MADRGLKVVGFLLVFVIVAVIFYAIGAANDGIPTWQHQMKVLKLERQIEKAKDIQVWQVAEWLISGKVDRNDMERLLWAIDEPIDEWDDPEDLEYWYNHRHVLIPPARFRQSPLDRSPTSDRRARYEEP